MKRCLIACLGLLPGPVALADSVAGIDRLLCATGRIVLCFEDGECYPVLAGEADVPPFVVIDLEERLMSTTRASSENRTTAINSVVREDGVLYLQGVELGRAFSFLIDEASGRVTVAVSRDGFSVTVFGACTDADVEVGAP